MATQVESMPINYLQAKCLDSARLELDQKLAQNVQAAKELKLKLKFKHSQTRLDVAVGLSKFQAFESLAINCDFC